jgi:putative peptide zinc metalloprotease protein
MSAAAPASRGGTAALPRLRTDLQIEETTAGPVSHRSLTVYDPLRGAYFRLSWPHSSIFLAWRDTESSRDIIERVSAEGPAPVTHDDVAEVIKFAALNQLTRFDPEGGWQRYATLKAASKHGWLKTIAHNYLFFRIPLVNPEPALRRLLPPLAVVFRPAFWVLVAAVAALGFYFASRQWSAVLSAFESSWQFQALLMFALAAFALKIVHELGHALTSAYYGCRVPSMGVAVMIGAPVLYTDTTDSWRLRRRGDRLRIVLAGVLAESIIAAVALLSWSFLDDGLLRQICFSLATTSVALSLAVNLNPLMRFDGYFALSDWLEVPNLQARAFAFGVWRLREALFKIGAPPPEAVPPRLRRTLIVYSYLTWIYRFFLFIGIAAIVYAMAGKAIGIVLGLFEIAVFIAAPVLNEVKAWWSLRDKIRRSPRAAATGLTAASAVMLFCCPIVRTVEVPAVLLAANEQEIHLPYPAQLTKVAVRTGDRVKAGQVLFAARSPDLEHRLTVARLHARRVDISLQRMHAHDEDREQRLVLQRELSLSHEKIASLSKELDRLTVKAPFDGTFGDHDTELAPGTWVSDQTVLARLMVDGPAQLKGLVSDKEWTRLTPGGDGVFIADEATFAKLHVVLHSVAPASDGHLSEPSLAAASGGQVPAAEVDGTWRLRDGWVEVRYESPAPAPPQMIRGIIRASAEPMSPLTLTWRQIARVFVREQNF